MAKQHCRVKFKMPDTYALLVIFIIFASFLTYIIPAGMYNKIQNTKLIDPNSFHLIGQTPVNIFKALTAISLGMIKSGKIIFSIFIVSGSFNVINDTGALEEALDILNQKLKDRVLLLIPVILIVMSVLGYMEIIVNQTIIFIPIGLLIAKKMKLDPIVGLSMMYLGTYVGFIFGGIGPFTVQVAQTLAGVPVLSGILFRTIFFVIALIATIFFLMHYVNKLYKNPDSSALDTTDYDWALETTERKNSGFSWKHKVIILAIFIAFGIYIYGAFHLKWGMNELNTDMLILAVFSAILAGKSVNGTSKSFVKGCRMATYSALLIGFATAVSVILTEGNIIATLIHYASIPLSHTSKMVSGVFIFFFNWIFNFFVPSGTGQAAVVIPILSPLADVINLSKQIIVSGYKYGDGITNLIVPTSGTLMGFIGMARIPYTKWLKFIFPLILIWTLLATVAIIIGVAIGW